MINKFLSNAFKKGKPFSLKRPVPPTVHAPDPYIKVKRFWENGDATIGIMEVGGKKVFTLEDEYRSLKKFGETRIKSGVYRVLLRSEGGMNERYMERFPHIHCGMLWLQNVEDFTHIYIHIGNEDDDTLGCILVGLGADLSSGTIQRSTDAYRLIYANIANQIMNGKDVYISIE